MPSSLPPAYPTDLLDSFEGESGQLFPSPTQREAINAAHLAHLASLTQSKEKIARKVEQLEAELTVCKAVHAAAESAFQRAAAVKLIAAPGIVVLPDDVLAETFVHAVRSQYRDWRWSESGPHVPWIRSRNALDCILRVSHRWREVALRTPRVWRIVDLANRTQEFRAADLQRQMQRAGAIGFHALRMQSPVWLNSDGDLRLACVLCGRDFGAAALRHLVELDLRLTPRDFISMKSWRPFELPVLTTALLGRRCDIAMEIFYLDVQWDRDIPESSPRGPLSAPRLRRVEVDDARLFALLLLPPPRPDSDASDADAEHVLDYLKVTIPPYGPERAHAEAVLARTPTRTLQVRITLPPFPIAPPGSGSHADVRGGAVRLPGALWHLGIYVEHDLHAWCTGEKTFFKYAYGLCRGILKGLEGTAEGEGGVDGAAASTSTRGAPQVRSVRLTGHRIAGRFDLFDIQHRLFYKENSPFRGTFERLTFKKCACLEPSTSTAAYVSMALNMVPGSSDPVPEEEECERHPLEGIVLCLD